MFELYVYSPPSLSSPLPPPSSPSPCKLFNNWMDNTLEDLQERVLCSSISDVEQLQAEFEKYKAGDLQDANSKYEDLNGLVQQMADLGATDNPYTTLTPQVG